MQKFLTILNGKITAVSTSVQSSNLYGTANQIYFNSDLLTASNILVGSSSFTIRLAQDINTISDVRFNSLKLTSNLLVSGSLYLSNAGTVTNSAVRADRQLKIIADLGLTSSNSGVYYNLTSDRTWTIKHATASGAITQTSSNSAQVISRLDRDMYGHITGSGIVDVHSFTTTQYPLSQSISNSTKTFSLLYNNSNLKLTSNSLDTIQDIHTGSDVIFKSLTVKNSSYSGSLSINSDNQLVMNRLLNIYDKLLIRDSNDSSYYFKQVVDNKSFSIVAVF